MRVLLDTCTFIWLCFDRLLVATAIGRRLSLLTPDEWMKRYPVSCLW